MKIIGPRASLRAHDQAHSHARGPMILICQGYAFDQQDVQNVSDAHPCHPERSEDLTDRSDTGRVAGDEVPHVPPCAKRGEVAR